MATQHTVRAYDEELDQLERHIAEMFHIASQMYRDSVTALTSGDAELARLVIEADEKLDLLEHQIEAETIHVIARRQPVAGDLRDVVAALRTASDLERIGDHAKNTAKRTIAVGNSVDIAKLSTGVRSLASLTGAQLAEIGRAYGLRDEEAALAVWHRDRDVDAAFTTVFRELLTYMMEDPRSISGCTHLLFCAKNIERIGDLTTNIAEGVWFMARGERLREERPKADGTIATSAP